LIQAALPRPVSRPGAKSNDCGERPVNVK
jgi:hypothetical protein